MAIATAMATSFKQELFAGGHCFNQNVTPTVSAASASASVTAVSSMAGIAVGMTATHASLPANTVVLRITSGTALTLSANTTAVISGAAMTFAGDVFNIALIKQGMTGTYGTASTNYTNITGSTDEVTGAGYTAGGQALTNVSATTSGVVAFVDFMPDPSWTTATFSTAGCMIYNASVRNGGTSGTNVTGGGRCCSVHDFGGSQQVSSGTFTVLMPNPDSNNAILRVA
jgi:hypothetical protein